MKHNTQSSLHTFSGPAGEALAGPYVWGRYDLLLLPPSFPYGGMENPCLTFVTPTLLAGDRSLTNVVAHEVGGMGNLADSQGFAGAVWLQGQCACWPGTGASPMSWHTRWEAGSACVSVGYQREAVLACCKGLR